MFFKTPASISICWDTQSADCDDLFICVSLVAHLHSIELISMKKLLMEKVDKVKSYSYIDHILMLNKEALKDSMKTYVPHDECAR